MKFELYYPTRPNIVYQKFGESLACVEDNQLPIAKRRVISKQNNTCPVGYVDLYHLLGMKGHTGEDMYGPDGLPVFNAGPRGIVKEVQTEVERGLGVGVVSVDKFDFEGGSYHAKTRYWHLKGINVKLGQVIETGDLIGWADNTGISSGNHLHFELKPVLYTDDYYYNVFQTNGYFGSVDPAPYYNKRYAEDGVPVPFLPVSKNLKWSDSGDEVKRLQTLLKKLGFFTYPDITGYYGSITRQAVLDFQIETGVIRWPIESLWGFYCGPKTRTMINTYT
jgi:hypothetical protein